MSWPTARLDECTRIVGGATPATGVTSYWGGDIPWATPRDLSDLDGSLIADTPRRITAQGLASCSAELLPANSVLFSSRAPIGHVAINTVPMATNQGFKSFIPDERRLLPRFLYWWLKTNRRYLEGLGNGATFKEVSKAVVARVEVPLPPLDEQRRITTILDQADELRGKRREVLDGLDRLGQSLFSNFFGDPVANTRNWTRIFLGELLSEIQGGWSPNCLDRPAAPGEWGVLKLGAVTYGRYDERAQKALPEGEAARQSLEVQQGDLLFTRKNTHDLVAACVLVRETRPRLLLPDLIFRLRLADSEKSHPEYVHALLSHPAQRKEIQRLASGAAGSMPNISKARLKTLSVPLPPPDLQLNFAKTVQELELMRRKVIANAAQLDALFASLQDRAFRGKL